jgi:hypothetical protein
MKKTFFLFLNLLVSGILIAQKNPVQDVTQSVQLNQVKAHLTFLASDEMRGRDTGSPEIDIAANYIASNFMQWGLKSVPGADGYFQEVLLEKSKPSATISFTIGDQVFKVMEDLVQYGGGPVSSVAEIVWAGYGSKEEMEKASIKGKIVVVFAGLSGENNMNKAYLTDAVKKDKDAKALGAVALVEVVAIPGMPWAGLAGYLGRERLGLKKEAGIPHLWMRNSDAPALKNLMETKKSSGKLEVVGGENIIIKAKNVIGLVEGTDPKLKNEFLVVSAHYDHVGVTKKPNQEDSIYNGARDNGIGTVGLMATAKYLSAFPPKRSVLLIALTGEEKGMLGSRWYTEHPLVPLKQTVFDFNCDGAGYNDKTIATIVGLERTSAEADLAKACEAFGLKATLDPVPEQNLYERSDNISFASKGIPAINFAPGTKAFDDELMKYYHQPADEVASLDFDYLIKYFRAYVYANHLLANMPKAPVWKAGDKFESAGKELYGN